VDSGSAHFEFAVGTEERIDRPLLRLCGLGNLKHWLLLESLPANGLLSRSLASIVSSYHSRGGSCGGLRHSMSPLSQNTVTCPVLDTNLFALESLLKCPLDEVVTLHQVDIGEKVTIVDRLSLELYVFHASALVDGTHHLLFLGEVFVR